MEGSLEPAPLPPAKKTTTALPNRNLKRERELRGWSQATVGEKIGAQSTLVNRWENGYAFPSPYYREKLCKLFDKDADELGLIKKPAEATAEQSPEKLVDSTPKPGLEDEMASVTIPEESSTQAETESSPQKRLFSRRSIIAGAGVVGGVAVATAGSLWWLSQHAAVQASRTPTIKLVYTYSPSPPYLVTFASWFPSKSAIACVTGDKTVKVLDAKSGALQFVYRGHTNFTNCAKWSLDAKRIASASTDKTVHVWKPLSSDRPLIYTGHSASVYCATWSNDGTMIASSGLDKTVQVWDAFDGTPLYIYKGHTATVWNVTWSPDDRSIATAGEDGGIQIWTALSGQKSPTFNYRGPGGTVTEIDWSPDGTRLVSTHIDSSVHICDTLTGYNMLTYKGHSAQTATARWSPDSKWIASADIDSVIHIWEAGSGKRLFMHRQPVQPLEDPSKGISEVTWAPDGKQLASSSYDGNMQVLRIDL